MSVLRSWVDGRMAARILAAMYLVGAFTGAIALAVPNDIAYPGLTWALVGATAVTGAVIFITGARLPGWAHFSFVSIGAAVIFGAALAGGTAHTTYSLPFVWLVLYSAYFFTERFIVAQLALILVGYAVVLATVDAAEVAPVTLWALTFVVLSLTAYVISTVVRHRTRAQSELRRYFDLAIDMLCTLRPDGTIVEANMAWLDALGYRPDSLLDRDLMELVHPDDREETAATSERLLAGEDTVDFENRYRTALGKWRWLNWRATYDADLGLIYARATDITERKERLEKVRTEARRDFLTGLPNRRWLSEEIAREISRASRSGSSLSLAVLDLDYFKDFNDSFGHLAGDELLRESAEAWDRALRDGDFIARIGGEEFVVLMPGCDLEEAVGIADRIRAATPIRVTCSAGVAEWVEGEGAEELLDRADRALYESKTGGRDRATPARV